MKILFAKGSAGRLRNETKKARNDQEPVGGTHVT